MDRIISLEDGGWTINTAFKKSKAFELRKFVDPYSEVHDISIPSPEKSPSPKFKRETELMLRKKMYEDLEKLREEKINQERKDQERRDKEKRDQERRDQEKRDQGRRDKERIDQERRDRENQERRDQEKRDQEKLRRERKEKEESEKRIEEMRKKTEKEKQSMKQENIIMEKKEVSNNSPPLVVTEKIPSGIRNPSNYCYAISIIQSLHPFLKFLKEKNFEKGSYSDALKNIIYDKNRDSTESLKILTNNRRGQESVSCYIETIIDIIDKENDGNLSDSFKISYQDGYFTNGADPELDSKPKIKVNHLYLVGGTDKERSLQQRIWKTIDSIDNVYSENGEKLQGVHVSAYSDFRDNIIVISSDPQFVFSYEEKMRVKEYEEPYYLRSVILYEGIKTEESSGGHYTSLVCHGKKWIYYDDGNPPVSLPSLYSIKKITNSGVACLWIYSKDECN